MRVEPDNADGRTLFCMVYTIGKAHATAGVVVRDTWASRCDGFVVMSDTEDPSLPAARVAHEGKEEYNNIWQKVRSIWKVRVRWGGETATTLDPPSYPRPTTHRPNTISPLVTPRSMCICIMETSSTGSTLGGTTCW